METMHQHNFKWADRYDPETALCEDNAPSPPDISNAPININTPRFPSETDRTT